VHVDDRSARIARTSGWERYTRGLLHVCGDDADVVPLSHVFGWLPSGRLVGDVATAAAAARVPAVHFPTYPPLLKHPRMAVTLHDLTWWRWPETASVLGRRVYRPMLQRSLQEARVLITHTRAMGDLAVKELSIDPTRIHVVSPGVELPEPDETWRAPDRPYLLAVGTVEPRKNLAFLVDAYAASGLTSQGIDLLLVGRRGWGMLPPGVRLLSGLTDGELAAAYRRARGIVLPSLHEGFGLPVAEALALGRPVACSDDPVLREVSGGHALYFSPQDKEDAVSALRSLVELDVAAPEAVEHARGYTWSNARAELRAAYEALWEERQ
jgi:glycosyltransferase involved in cell wall biosynthesis